MLHFPEDHHEEQKKYNFLEYFFTIIDSEISAELLHIAPMQFLVSVFHKSVSSEFLMSLLFFLSFDTMDHK